MDAQRNQLGAAQTAGNDEDNQWGESGPVTIIDQPGAGGPLSVITEEHSPGPCVNDSPAVNPDFVLVRGDYRVRIANEESQLHTHADKLVTSLYGSRGLMTDTTANATSQPEQVTLAASSGHGVFGTLTLGVDSDTGLQADSLYQQEIDALRSQGGRLCEVTRLAIAPELNCPEVMATIFNVAFILAKEVHDRTDLLVEVHPRHAPFYRRTMGYQIAGPVRICPRVSAPAVLMHLCLDFARQQILRLEGAMNDRSLYRLFLPPAEQEVLLQKLITTESAND